METRFKKKSQIIDIGITAAALVLSLGDSGLPALFYFVS